MPFVDNTFDAVVSFDVVEHIDNDKLFAAEAYRVCKENGCAIVGTPNRLRLSNRLKSIIGKKVVYPYVIGPGVIHLREYSSEEYISLLQSVGFLGECKSIWIGIVNRFCPGLSAFPYFLKPFVQYLIFLGHKQTDC